MTRTHPYIPNSSPDIKERMMEELGIKSIDELYSDIPHDLWFTGKLDIPGPLTENEVRKSVTETLEKNWALDCPPFLGGGVWPHYVPSVVDEIVGRAEFLTTYTPYQPESSQGMIQAQFEYQSMICELVGLEITNASVFDWGTALGEAARMTNRLNRRRDVIVPTIIHPDRLSVLKTYVDPADIKILEADYDPSTGLIDLEDLKEKVGKETSAVYIENPSYLGFIEEQAEDIGEIAHDAGALFIVGVDPISLGLLKAPGDYGADIVIGEGQPLGNHMNYGGPLLGIFACKADRRMARQLPGRIMGMTVTVDKKERGFVMALMTREQHIRRERATSSICTNEALCAVAAAVYLSLLGPTGLRDLCELITSRAHYATRRIAKLSEVRAPIFNAYHFKEFTVNFGERPAEEIHSGLLERRIHGGKYIGKEFPQLGETALFCVTEVHSKADIDMLVSAMAEVLEG